MQEERQRVWREIVTLEFVPPSLPSPINHVPTKWSRPSLRVIRLWRLWQKNRTLKHKRFSLVTHNHKRYSLPHTAATTTSQYSNDANPLPTMTLLSHPPCQYNEKTINQIWYYSLARYVYTMTHQSINQSQTMCSKAWCQVAFGRGLSALESRKKVTTEQWVKRRRKRRWNDCTRRRFYVRWNEVVCRRWYRLPWHTPPSIGDVNGMVCQWWHTLPWYASIGQTTQLPMFLSAVQTMHSCICSAVLKTKWQLSVYRIVK